MTQEEMTDLIYEMIDVDIDEGAISQVSCENNIIYLTTFSGRKLCITVVEQQ